MRDGPHYLESQFAVGMQKNNNLQFPIPDIFDCNLKTNKQTMENGKIQPLAVPKPLNRSTQNLKQVIKSEKRLLCKISCKSVHWPEAYRQMGEI